MYDNALYKIFRSLMLAALPARGLGDVLVLRNFQPTQQGRQNGRVIYFSKVFDLLHGSPQESTRLSADKTKRVMKNLQVVEDTWQISATITSDPASTTELSPSDLVRVATSIMRSEPFRKALISQGANILRSRTINVPFFDNDRSQWEQNPTTEIILITNDNFEYDVNALSAFEAILRRV